VSDPAPDSTAATAATAAPATDVVARARRFLLPDYDDRAAAFWTFLVVLGGVALAHATVHAVSQSWLTIGQIAWATACAAWAGMFPVQLPRTRHAFAAGEIFIFVLLLQHGAEAATVAAAAESAIATWRASRRWSSRIASPAIAAISVASCGAALDLAMTAIADGGMVGGALRWAAVLGCAAADFAINTLLLSAVLCVKRREPLRLAPWWRDFSWVGLVTVASASIAAALAFSAEKSSLVAPMMAAPIIALFVGSMRLVFRQQRADDERQQERLETAERHFEDTFTHASIGMALVSGDGSVLRVNPALAMLLGASGDSLVGKSFVSFVDATSASMLPGRFAALLAPGGQHFQLDVRHRDEHGADHCWSLFADVFGSDRRASGCLILQVHDVTARRQAEERLEHIAYHDSLTGLVNRNRFHDMLAAALERSHDNGQARFAVLYLDFDRFKLVNDSLGHQAGDEFLVLVAARIRESVRRGNEVARLGGDEFAILLEGVDAHEDAPRLAERLHAALGRPMMIRGTEVVPTASIGITTSTFGYLAPEDVLRDADIAMYRAKSRGRARHVLFDSSLRAHISEQLTIEAELRRAIETEQLGFALQPLNRLAGRQLVGFEALARWRHPERGWISPATFIPIAEDSGLMTPLTERMLDLSCRQLVGWHQRDSALEHLRIHVNVSGSSIGRPGFVKRLEATLAATGLRPSALVLEITESVLMERFDSTIETIGQLRELGVGLSVDDFGTGYSSLSYLSSLPITSLKIDASFVRRMTESRQDAEIVRAVVSLGGALGKKVIAEGIETEAQLKQLKELGCEFGQGYLFAKPLDPVQADALALKLLATGVAAAMPHAAPPRVQADAA